MRFLQGWFLLLFLVLVSCDGCTGCPDECPATCRGTYVSMDVGDGAIALPLFVCPE